MSIAALSLGSNQGNRLEFLRQAVDALQAATGIDVVNTSPVYETDPVGYEEQPAFLNMAVTVKTDLAPLDLLDACQQIENSLGRVRTVRWGPRTVDIDILLFDEVCLQTERLKLPHPRMTERAFVLVPLLDILPDAQVCDGSARDFLKRLREEESQRVDLFAPTEAWLAT